MCDSLWSSDANSISENDSEFFIPGRSPFIQTENDSDSGVLENEDAADQPNLDLKP